MGRCCYKGCWTQMEGMLVAPSRTSIRKPHTIQRLRGMESPRNWRLSSDSRSRWWGGGESTTWLQWISQFPTCMHSISLRSRWCANSLASLPRDTWHHAIAVVLRGVRVKGTQDEHSTPGLTENASSSYRQLGDCGAFK